MASFWELLEGVLLAWYWKQVISKPEVEFLSDKGKTVGGTTAILHLM